MLQPKIRDVVLYQMCFILLHVRTALFVLYFFRFMSSAARAFAESSCALFFLAIGGGGGGGGGGAFTNTTCGAATDQGAAGGSGVVIVRVPGCTSISVAPGTNSIATCVGPANDKVATFTVSGTLTIS